MNKINCSNCWKGQWYWKFSYEGKERNKIDIIGSEPLIEVTRTKPLRIWNARLIGGISFTLSPGTTSTTSRTNGTARTKSRRLSKTEPRETSCVTVVLEFRCSQQRDSLSSNGHTLLNIPVDDKVPSAALSPPLVFVGQRDSLRRLPGDCNNIFCAEAHEGCATNERENRKFKSRAQGRRRATRSR